MGQPLKRKVITLKVRSGCTPIRISAVIIGPFGVHKDDLSSAYSVTHVQSGYSAGQGLWRERSRAIHFARQLAKCKLIDWDFIDPFTIPGNTWKKLGRVRQQLLNDAMVQGKRRA